jgi:hypothetical protein
LIFNPAAPTIDMKDDLERLVNPLEKLVKGQIDEQSGETRIYFDNLHLSLLKVKKKFLFSFERKIFE